MSIAPFVAALKPLVGDRVHRDHTIDDTFPYIVIHPDIVPSVPALTGDGRTLGRRHEHQIDLYQTADAEDDNLIAQVLAAIEAAAGANGLRGFRAPTYSRSVDPDDQLGADVVHHAITARAVSVG